MITQNDLLQALRERMEQVFPGDKCYTEMAPKNFERPSTLIEIDEIAMERLNYSMIQVTVTVRVTCFAVVDVYHNSQFAELSQRQTRVFAQLLPGYFQVGDRALRVDSVRGSGGFDYTEVLANFEWETAAAEFLPADDSPMMQDYALPIKPQIE